MNLFKMSLDMKCKLQNVAKKNFTAPGDGYTSEDINLCISMAIFQLFINFTFHVHMLFLDVSNLDTN